MNQKKSARIALGKWGEQAALEYLTRQGYQCLERNFRCLDGEIDLVMLKDDELVFVEVKTRKNTRHSYPEEAVSDEKLEHMEAAASCFLEKGEDHDADWRFDVIAIVGTPATGIIDIQWYKDVHE